MRYLLIIILMLSFAYPAFAEKPEQSKAIYIALLHQKMTGKKPDFQAWIEDSPAFKNAALHERVEMMQHKTEQLKNVYGLLSDAEPIVLEIPLRMTSYSKKMRAFQVPAFANNTFFVSYEYLGKNYAVIPDKITSYEWLKSPPGLANSIMEATDNGRNAKILLTLSPHSTDKAPVLLRGKKYYLLMTEISKMEIWSKDGERTVWDSAMNRSSTAKNQLLNLYQ